MNQSVVLVRPSTHYKQSFIEAVREFQVVDGKRPPWKYEMLDENFDEYVQIQLERETDPPAGFVPQRDYWLIVAGAYAGRISIRHQLNEALHQFGGHIGYEVRPSMRRKGYATVQLKLALQQAHQMGLGRVLITCNDDNIGSIKVIERNGGILQDIITVDGHALPVRRYWIALPPE